MTTLALDDSFRAPWWQRLFAVARGSGGGPRKGKKKGLLSEREIESIERKNADGLTAPQVVEIFVARELRFSEATLRKYVQLGLLPRSRRIGRKGKHRGSLGVYPVRVVRRINDVKRLMGQGYTIEEIQENFFRYTDMVDAVKDALGLFFSEVTPLVGDGDSANHERLNQALDEARDVADSLVESCEQIAQLTAQIQEDAFRGSGAAGSAEDLL